MKTPPADDDARAAELLKSATDDENAGRWDAARLKLQLAQAHRNTPEVAERLARAERRGEPPPVSSRLTPAPRPVSNATGPSGLRSAPSAVVGDASAQTPVSSRTTPGPRPVLDPTGQRSTPSAVAGGASAAPPVSSRSTPGARVPHVPPASPSRPRASPMPMLLLSVLRNQHLLLGAAFATRYPHPWLVWELGPRRPAASAVERNTLETQRPSQAGAPKAAGHDPLCFPLFGTSLRVGRGDDCAIVIDDVTFSRDAGVLSLVGASWSFHPSAGGAPVPLEAGSTVQSGDVTLTFETSTSFVARLSRPGA